MIVVVLFVVYVVVFVVGLLFVLLVLICVVGMDEVIKLFDFVGIFGGIGLVVCCFDGL